MSLIGERRSNLFFDGAFRSKGLDDGFIGLDVRPANEINAVRHGSEDARNNGFAVYIFETLQRFCNRLGLSW